MERLMMEQVRVKEEKRLQREKEKYNLSNGIGNVILNAITDVMEMDVRVFPTLPLFALFFTLALMTLSLRALSLSPSYHPSLPTSPPLCRRRSGW